MAALIIKDATIKDIPLLRELTFKIWPPTYSSILSQQQITYMLEKMYSVPALTEQFNELQHHFILACYDGQPAGFASYAAMGENIFKLHKIYVLPALQGKNIGTGIINHIIADIKADKAIALDLNVNRFNQAKNFYKKLGFIILKEEDIDIGKGYFMNDYVLRLMIA